MKIGIETKYNIGDEVWVWSIMDKAPMQAKITNISWKYCIGATDYCNTAEFKELMYDIRNEWRCLKYLKENELFRTPEELYQFEVKKIKDKLKKQFDEKLKQLGITEMPDFEGKENASSK